MNMLKACMIYNKRYPNLRLRYAYGIGLNTTYIILIHMFLHYVSPYSGYCFLVP